MIGIPYPESKPNWDDGNGEFADLADVETALFGPPGLNIELDPHNATGPKSLHISVSPAEVTFFTGVELRKLLES